MYFPNRAAAGRRLAQRLAHLREQDVVVLGLPRGGVPVAFEVARALHAPLDVIVVRKLGVPFQPELALGAIGEDGTCVFNLEVVRATRLEPEEVTGIERAMRAELIRRIQHLRHGRARVPLLGRIAVLVDDGVATGATARAACQVARAQGARRVVLATPVASPGAVAAIGTAADEVICVQEPLRLRSIGEWYEDFSPTTDADVEALLDRAAAGDTGAAVAAGDTGAAVAAASS
jgi:putative phosphoribosyl transferase